VLQKKRAVQLYVLQKKRAVQSRRGEEVETDLYLVNILKQLF
jgi:hypothetical protein